MTTTVTDSILTPILERDPAGPRVTYYDDATGERIELSALTLANWAAKTANFLRDEIALAPRATVLIDLPAHWQTAAVLLGAWWAGLHVIPAAERTDEPVDAALVTVSGQGDVDDVSEVVVLSLDPFGKPAPDLPIGVTDYATAVRVHGDQFVPGDPGGAALGTMSVPDLLSAATARGAATGFGPADRVMSAREWVTTDDIVDGLLAVLHAGASLVQVRGMDPAAADRRAETEKVTRVLD